MRVSSRRRHWPLALGAIGAMACHSRSTATGGGDAFRPAQVGDLMPAYTMPTLRGDTVRIAAGMPVTLLNVWATWCTSCREEMAALDTLERQFGPRGLRVVAVSVDGGDPARVARYVHDAGLTFTVVHDPAGVVEDRYAVVGVPSTFLVGTDGVLRWQQAGNVTDSLASLRSAIDRALAHAPAR